jgi:hypothetical protein
LRDIIAAINWLDAKPEKDEYNLTKPGREPIDVVAGSLKTLAARHTLLTLEVAILVEALRPRRAYEPTKGLSMATADYPLRGGVG